jgi:hypothetical protein
MHPSLLELSSLRNPWVTPEQEEEETRTSLLLHLLQHFLQGKQGNVSDTLLASMDKQAHVLFCTYKSEGHSMHQSILGPLKQSTPIQHFGAALKDQDEILRHVASQALEKLQPGHWQEVLLISVELPEPESVQVKREGPLQLVFCGLGYREASSMTPNEEQAPVQNVDHPDEPESKERTAPPLARQLVAAYTERWRSSLCERAHEMTGLKLFYETNEETASERVQPWSVKRTNTVHSPHQYS